MKKQITSTLLLIAMLVSVSCGGSGGSEDSLSSSGGDESTTAPAETTSRFVDDDLPDDLSLGDATVKIMIGDYNNAYIEDMYSEEETGNRLGDAVYNMIGSVSERLDTKLEYNYTTYTWGELSGFQTRITQGIMAGDNEFDLFFDVQNYAAQMLDGEYFVDLDSQKYINLDKPYYNQTVRANMANDYVHFTSGQFALANVKNTFAIYFNDELYKSLGMTEDLYALVDSGKWTLDALDKLTKDVYADLDGSTDRSAGDRYALTFGDENKYMGFVPALGVRMFEKTSDGYEFTYDNERALEVMDRVCRFINENENVLPYASAKSEDYVMSSGGGNSASKLFVEGNALFTGGLVADAAAIVPEIGFEYGILPYPKWSENEEYTTMLQRSCYAFIPTTAANVDYAGAVLEALASESYRSLVPEYCEVTLKTRYSQDEDVSRMFDLIINSIIYDPGEIYSNLLGTPSGMIKSVVTNNDPNWASRIAGQKDSFVSKMASVTE